jgi:hypothetical protein
MMRRSNFAAANRGECASKAHGKVRAISNSKPESGCTCMTDGVWMTKAELAAARRISVGSADRLIRQRRWKRQPGDDGGTKVSCTAALGGGPRIERHGNSNRIGATKLGDDD